MATLKKIREKLGITQAEVATKLSIAISQYSLLEAGKSVPSVEDCIQLEREFSQPIDWHDPLTEAEKAEIMENLTALSKIYPLSSVLTFAQKWLRQDVKLGKAGRSIRFFTEQALSSNVEYC
jgi:transcriptional regulator with XRE-family HTH domain